MKGKKGKKRSRERKREEKGPAENKYLVQKKELKEENVLEIKTQIRIVHKP